VSRTLDWIAVGLVSFSLALAVLGLVLLRDTATVSTNLTRILLDTLGMGGLIALFMGATLLSIGIFASTLWLIGRLQQYSAAMFVLLVVGGVLSLLSRTGWYSVIFQLSLLIMFVWQTEFQNAARVSPALWTQVPLWTQSAAPDDEGTGRLMRRGVSIVGWTLGLGLLTGMLGILLILIRGLQTESWMRDQWGPVVFVLTLMVLFVIGDRSRERELSGAGPVSASRRVLTWILGVGLVGGLLAIPAVMHFAGGGR
jgi:hypothetical protein